MDIRVFLRHFLQVAFVLDLIVTQAQPESPSTSETPSPPCMGCRLFNLGHREPPNNDKKFLSQPSGLCHYPCQCPMEYLNCQAGVNVVKDGCSCCYMCARQLEDMCSFRDLCDVKKELYCSAKDVNSTGTCYGLNNRSCQVKGAIYRHKEQFYMGCSRLCTCQNGFAGCVSLCPQEHLKPSELTCHAPKLMKVKNKCCKEWTCQKLDTSGQPLSSDRGLESQNLIMKNPLWYRTSTSKPTTTVAPLPLKQTCKAVKTDWSPCTVTCGVGVSLRLVVDKETCENHEERQLCYLRPCGVVTKTLGRAKCTPTTRTNRRQHIRYQDCISLKKYKPKFCTNCKHDRCCFPTAFKTKSVKFQCTGGNTEVMNFMWLKKCVCRTTCYGGEQKSGKKRNIDRKKRKIDRRKRRKERQRKRNRRRRYFRRIRRAKRIAS